MTPALTEAVEQQIQDCTPHFWNPPGTTLVVCVLALGSGFTVLGEAVCLDPAAFDPEHGQKLAFQKAVDALAGHEAYRQATAGPRLEMPTANQVRLVSGNG